MLERLRRRTSHRGLDLPAGHLGMAQAEIYPVGGPDYVDHIEYGSVGIKKGREYLGQMFPDINFRLLSDEGSSAVVFADDQSRAWKVYRDAHNYDYKEKEAAVLTVLSQEGLTPKPLLFIDADVKHRRGRGAKYIHGFGQVTIPRHASEGNLPILITERVNHQPLERANLTPAKLLSEFDRIAKIALRLGIRLGDVEFVHDTDRDTLRIIDAGGVYFYNENQKYIHGLDGEKTDMAPGLTQMQFKQAAIISDVLSHLHSSRRFRDPEEVHAVLKDLGWDGIHGLLLKGNNLVQHGRDTSL